MYRHNECQHSDGEVPFWLITPVDPKQMDCWYEVDGRNHGLSLRIPVESSEGIWPCLGESAIVAMSVVRVGREWLEL